MSVMSFGNGSRSSLLSEMKAYRDNLEAEKRKIEAAIAALEEEDDAPEPGPAARQRGRAPTDYSNVSFIEAAKRYLKAHGPETTNNIAYSLISGGFQTSSKNFSNTSRTLLKRSERTNGEVYFEDGKWHLS